jgi:ankyrin repeat protein
MKKISVFILFLLIIVLNSGCSPSVKEATKSGNIAEVLTRVKNEGNINYKDKSGYTPLHYAAEYGQMEIAQYLVSNGANINARDNDGYTPLQLAVFEEHKDLVVFLVSNGADVNAVNNYRISPIYRAILSNNYEIANFLVSKGANVNAKAKSGYAPIHEAAKLGNFDFIRFLVTNRADVNIKGPFDNTALHYAVEDGNFEIIKYLVSQGANVNYRNKVGNTPLHIAVKSGKLKTIQYLMSNGADEKAKDNSDFTPKMLAHKLGQHDIENFLSNFENHEKINAYTPELKAANKENKLVISKETTTEILPEIELGNYYALIIGIDNYKFLPKLKTAINDAQTVASVLKQNYGFEVKLLIDAKRSDLLLSLGKFRKTLTKQDNLIIYYAGHGWLDEAGDEGYWLPANAEIDNTINWVSNSSITTALKAMAAKHVLVVADSCYSGKLARGLHVVQRTPNYLSRLSQKRARCVISSGGLEPVIDSGGKGLHSVFASAFLETLKENKGVMDGAQLFNRLRRPVMLNSEQTPEYSDIRKAGHEGGEFIFLRKK